VDNAGKLPPGSDPLTWMHGFPTTPCGRGQSQKGPRYFCWHLDPSFVYRFPVFMPLPPSAPLLKLRCIRSMPARMQSKQRERLLSACQSAGINTSGAMFSISLLAGSLALLHNWNELLLAVMEMLGAMTTP